MHERMLCWSVTTNLDGQASSMKVSRITARGVSKILTPIKPSPNFPTDLGTRPIVADTFTHRPRQDNNKRRINSHRFAVNTPEKAKQLLESWGLHERRKPFTVVEMFAGPLSFSFRDALFPSYAGSQVMA